MKTEVSFIIKPSNEDVSDAIIAFLSELGYDGFQYLDNGFSAYIPSQDFDEKQINDLDILKTFSNDYSISWTVKKIEDRDWNKEWEDNFTPVNIDNTILIRAGFHEKVAGIKYDIIIEPKMSFGTGHHPTTALMLKNMVSIADKFTGADVLDMGCGTGILSIMAAKLGATKIVGIDIDSWAYTNAGENMKNNKISNIQVKIGDAGLLKNETSFDIILANINRNIILDDIDKYVKVLKKGGIAIFSGFYNKDLAMIKSKAETLNLTYVSMKEDKDWVSAIFHNK